MITTQVSSYLNNNNIDYKTLIHHQTYTALETAESAHISGKILIKPMMVWIDDILSMVLVPANYQVSTGQLAKTLTASRAVLATEAEFSDCFKGCQAGALPALGNLFDLKVYAADILAKQKHICFSGGGHDELIQMSWQDFYKLAKPIMISAGFKKALTPPRVGIRRHRPVH